MSTKYTIYDHEHITVMGDVFEEDIINIKIDNKLDLELILQSNKYKSILLKLDKKDFKNMCKNFLEWCQDND